MTPTLFAIVLGCIGFLSGIMSFSEDVAKHPKFKFMNTLPIKIIFLVIATVGTIYATTLYNSRTDKDIDTKLALQDSMATAKQNQRDSINRRHIDSITRNTVEILARYGLKVDSANNAIVKAIDTSMGRTTPILSVYTKPVSGINYKSEHGNLHFPLGLQNMGNASAYNVHFFWLPIGIHKDSIISTKQFSDVYKGERISLGIMEYLVNEATINNAAGINIDTIFLVMKINFENAVGKNFKFNEIYAYLPNYPLIGRYIVTPKSKLEDYLINNHIKYK